MTSRLQIASGYYNSFDGVIGMLKKDADEFHDLGLLAKSASYKHVIAELEAVFLERQSTPTSIPGGMIACPCTTFGQDESCPAGFPSLLCSACDGIGRAKIEKVVSLAAEMMKIAEQVDELEDPFAAWESVDLIQSQHAKLRDAGQSVVSSASDTYKKRNGHLAGFEDDSGEKCWIVPFDAFETLRAALGASATEGSADV